MDGKNRHPRIRDLHSQSTYPWIQQGRRKRKQEEESLGKIQMGAEEKGRQTKQKPIAYIGTKRRPT